MNEDSNKAFFQEEKNLKILDEFIRQEYRFKPTEKNAEKRFSRVLVIIKSIQSTPDRWDKKCTFNINHIGSNFIAAINNFNDSNSTPGSLTSLDGIVYPYAYRFLYEYDFFMDKGYELAHDISAVKGDMEKNLENSRVNSYELNWLKHDMFFKIISYAFQNECAIFGNALEKAKETENGIEQKITEHEQILGEKIEEVKKLKEALEKHKTAFNFVGLSAGFEKLRTQKKHEKTISFWGAVVMGLFLIALPLAVLLIRGQESNLFDFKYLILSLSLISLEIILIYFFRLVFHNYKTLKTQIMQIELRQALCQFIQSYAQYSVEVRKDNTEALTKFENLVFSEIMETPEKIPGAYDGLENMIKLLKSAKS